MAEARSGGLRIAYDDVGQGEPALLCLPGWCSSRAVYEPLTVPGAARRRVLAVDWRGHGQSESPTRDFGLSELVEDARAVVERSGVRSVVPVATAHAGWVAIALRRALGPRVPRLVLLEWIVLDPPAPFLDALAGLQAADRWEATRERLFSMWLGGSADARVREHVRGEMGAHGFPMWARAGREIAGAYAASGNPLRALSSLDPPVPTLHLYCLPKDPAYLAAQQAFAAEHPWFTVERLTAETHFPTLEAPDAVTAAIERFVG